MLVFVAFMPVGWGVLSVEFKKHWPTPREFQKLDTPGAILKYSDSKRKTLQPGDFNNRTPQA